MKMKFFAINPSYHIIEILLNEIIGIIFHSSSVTFQKNIINFAIPQNSTLSLRNKFVHLIHLKRGKISKVIPLLIILLK